MNPTDPNQPQTTDPNVVPVDPMAPQTGVPGVVPPAPIVEPPVVEETPAVEPPVETQEQPVSTPEPVIPPMGEQPASEVPGGDQGGNLPPTMPPAV